MSDAAEAPAVASLGCGVIGSAWAVLFGAYGLRVKAYDPDFAAKQNLERTAEQASAVLGLSAEALLGRIAFTTDLGEALHGATFVQESAPDALELKQSLYAEVDRLVAPPVVVASSTSGLPISQIQACCLHPERTVVGHPINPPYAVPLVEVVGGAKTSAEAIQRACDFYRSIGRYPLQLDREVFGFVANRLQLALLREALQLILHREATVSQVDEALMHGVAPRWSAVGVFGAFALNLPVPDANAWLEHFERIGFGESSVHTEPFTAWSADARVAIADQWKQRIDRSGAKTLGMTRDRLILEFARLRAAAEKSE